MQKNYIITTQKDMLPGPLSFSVIGRAIENNITSVIPIALQDFADPPHYKVDDQIYGGGSGMLLKADVLDRAIHFCKKEITEDTSQDPGKTDQLLTNNLYLLSPRGQKIDQKFIQKTAQNDHNIFICGRYEGVDQRIINEHNITEISLGDFIISGGELACMCIIDAMTRLQNGAIKPESIKEDSFSINDSQYLLEYDQYTRPYKWKNHHVPDILITGNHQKIADWKIENSKLNTQQLRPDLWEKYQNSLLEKTNVGNNQLDT